MAGSAGTAFVDLQPRFGAGWVSGIEKEIGGVTSRLGGGLQKLDRELAGFGVPFSGQLSTIGTHLQGVTAAEGEAASGASKFGEIGSAALLGVGAAAAGFGVLSAKAFLGGQDASAQYEQALKNVGESHGELDGRLDSTVKLMAKYGFENDAVETSAATLTRATKDGAKALDLEALAADLAAGRHLDLASATGILAKVETGHVALLGRLGINTKDATGATITQEEAIQRLTALYGGSAAAQAKTYAGELRALGAEAHNVEEELGARVVPALIGVGKGAVDSVGAIQSANSATHGWIGTLGLAGIVGGGLALTTSKITGAATDLAAGEGATATASGFLGTALEALAPPLVAIGAGFVIGKKAGDELNDLVVGTKPNVDRLTASLIDLEKGQDGFDFSKFGADLNDQITRSGNPLKLPIEFGQSLGDFFTGGGAHKAKAEIGPLNEALEQVLQTDGVDKATLAYGRFQQGLYAEGVSAKVVANDFEPFLAKLDLAREKTDAASGSSSSLADRFAALDKQLAAQSGQLAIGDSFDQLRDAEKDLQRLREDAAGTGPEVVSAIREETTAREGLSSAVESEASASRTLGDAQAALAEFDGPTDTTVRSLERTQIVDRVVTSPEEARQKEIDLLQFDEQNADKRADLQKQIQSAEQGVQDATEKVGDAQRAVADAATNRQKVQTDAAAAVEGAERKVQEAAIASADAIEKAGGLGQHQLAVYLQMLDDLTKTLDPSNPLRKNLDQFVHQMQLGAGSGTGLPARTPAELANPGFANPYKGTDYGEHSGLHALPAATTHIDARQTVHVHGNTNGATVHELAILNKQQAIRLRIGAR